MEGEETAASSSSTGTSGPDDQCGTAEFMFEAMPARVLLVLDKSRSMVTNTWDHDNDPDSPEITRWASLHATVDVVTTTFDGGLELGVLLYPSLDATSTYDENACVVADAPEVAVGPANGQAVIDAVPPADADTAIAGGTPSAIAMTVALDHLRDLDTNYPRAVLFVTDGEANCRADADPSQPTQLFEEYDWALHSIVEDAFQTDGIPTYVVGIAIRQGETPVGGAPDGIPDGIDPHERLDELAVQGGRPRPGAGARYYATENQLELEAALQEIAAQEVSCVVSLDPEPEHPDLVEIQIGGETVERVDDCASENGWTYVTPDGPFDAIELCGTACELLAAEGELEAFFGCPPPA
jgi:hypothetical protein